MSVTDTDRAKKILLDKRATSSLKAIYEEEGDETLTITNDQIWSDTVADNDPNTAVAANIAEFRSKFVLTQDVTVGSQQAWFANDGYRLKDWIPDRFGTAYTTKLFDNNDNEIFTTDAVDWLFDYKTGILTFNNTPSAFAQPFKLDGYRYIGQRGFGDAQDVGSYRVVDDRTARDAIPSIQRRIGMVVRFPDGRRFTLGAGLTNSDWVVLTNDGYEFQTTNFSSTFQPDVELFVETTGSDATGDGRSVATAFATLQRAFDEISPTFVTFTLVSMGSGSFAGARLESNGSGTVLIDGYRTVLDTISFVSDGGLLSGKANQRTVTVSSFDGYDGYGNVLEGSQFLRKPIPGFDLFSTGTILRSSTSPTLLEVRPVTEFFTTAEIYEPDTIFTSGVSGSDTSPVTLSFLTIDTSIGTWSGVNLNVSDCKITGGGLFVLSENVTFTNVYSEDSVAIGRSGPQLNNYQGLLLKNFLELTTTAVPLSRLAGVFDSTVTPKVQVGGSGGSSISNFSISNIGPIDFEGASDCVRMYPNGFVFQDSTITCEGTGKFLEIRKSSTYDANGKSVTGTVTAPIEIDAGSQLTGASGIALINTSTPGDDVIVGEGAAADAFSDLPVINLSDLSRATTT